MVRVAACDGDESAEDLAAERDATRGLSTVLLPRIALAQKLLHAVLDPLLLGTIDEAHRGEPPRALQHRRPAKPLCGRSGGRGVEGLLAPAGAPWGAGPLQIVTRRAHT